MPPMGGAQLSQADLAAVADYVWRSVIKTGIEFCYGGATKD